MRNTGNSRDLVRTGDRLGAGEIFEFVMANEAHYPIATKCRVLEVSTSGYHGWRKRKPSQREQEDVQPLAQIRTIHTR